MGAPGIVMVEVLLYNYICMRACVCLLKYKRFITSVRGGKHGMCAVWVDKVQCIGGFLVAPN